MEVKINNEEYDELFPTTVVASNKYEIGKEKL